MNPITEHLKKSAEEFDKELIPIDYLTSMAGEGLIKDKGVAIVVAEFHTERIKQYLLSKIREAYLIAAEEVEESNKPLPFSADPNNPLKHVYQNEGYIRGLTDAANRLREGVKE